MCWNIVKQMPISPKWCLLRREMFCQAVLLYYKYITTVITACAPEGKCVYTYSQENGVKLKLASLAFGFNTTKIKSIKFIPVYLELYQTIAYHQLLKRQFLSIPPNIMTTKYNDRQHFQPCDVCVNLACIMINVLYRHHLLTMVTTINTDKMNGWPTFIPYFKLRMLGETSTTQYHTHWYFSMAKIHDFIFTKLARLLLELHTNTLKL